MVPPVPPASRRVFDTHIRSTITVCIVSRTLCLSRGIILEPAMARPRNARLSTSQEHKHEQRASH